MDVVESLLHRTELGHLYILNVDLLFLDIAVGCRDNVDICDIDITLKLLIQTILGHLFL